MKITLLAWSRESGGAERQLVNLACGLHGRGHDVLVIVFFPNPYVEAPLLKCGIPHQVLGVRSRWDAWRYVYCFLRAMLQREHEIVYSFLQFPNLLTVPFKLLRPRSKVVWGIRNSDLNTTPDAWGRLVSWVESRLSSIAALVVANSFQGRDDALVRGFDPQGITVIHNGIDTDLFRPDTAGGAQMRAAWQIPADAKVIGLVGRFESKKAHDVFLRAAFIALSERPDIYFVCVGEGSAPARAGLEAQVRDLGLKQRLVWPGFCWNMSAVYSALDLATLSSAYGEGFPNTVAEAMACGRPCVVTRVGDAPLILGDMGWVVPPADPHALAGAWLEALAQGPNSGISVQRRQRIIEEYPLQRMVDQTEQALAALL